MPGKLRNLCPSLLLRILKRTLPHSFYRRHIGRHDDESVRLWKRFAANVLPDKVIIDIGAFHGTYSLAAREVNSTAAVYAFEPNPYAAEVLRMACEGKGIEIKQLAIAEHDGRVPFLCASATSRIVAFPVPQEQSIYVPAVSLDSWVIDNAVVPALVKIDTEGAEAGILRGAKRMLIEHQPIILCEVLTDLAGGKVMEALSSCYHFYHIDENRGIEERVHITRRRWRNLNWLLVPENRQPECESKRSTHVG